jgi:protein CpxP
MTYIRSGVRLAAAVIFAALAAQPAHAQNPQPGRPGVQGPPNERRAELEQRFRERTGEIVKRRLGLTDDQMAKLQANTQNFEKQRADLMARERQTRMALRGQLLSGDSANQNRVSQLLDQSIQLQRQRLDLLQSEQRELAKFLTPVQRAKFVGFQNEVRKRAQAMRAQQGRPGGMQGQMRRRMEGPMGGQMRRPMQLPPGDGLKR